MSSYNNRRRRRLRTKRPEDFPLNSVPLHRMRLVFAFLCMGLVGLLVRMAWLQVLQSPVLEARARSFQTHQIKPLGRRRTIVDRMGKLVAFDEERYRLWAHPRYFNFPGDDPSLIRSPLDVAQKISQLVKLPIDELDQRLSSRASGVKIAEGLDTETATTIRNLRISGLDLEAYPQRLYPQGQLFANVVGFLNQDRVPQAGLEQSQNRKLFRDEKAQKLRRGADGTPLPDDIALGSFSGDDLKLQLTLDSRLQKLAFQSLTAQVKKWGAKKGVAIVMDVSNGELLALVSAPTYDPNAYWKYSPALFREWSVQDLFEPGSTFKPINLALALEERVISSKGTVDDDGGLVIGGWPIYNNNREINGRIGYAKVLQVSSNVGMVKTMRKMPPSRYWDWLHRLGLDVKPKTDLPGAVAGQLKSKNEFVSRPIEPATAAFGQGFSLTPLKLAQLHALIANGGYLVDPHITRNVLLSRGISSINSNQSKRLFRSDVTETVRLWMESVVEEGSGKGVQTPGYRIAGKTGTAQKASNGVYLPNALICSFVANLPAQSPRYVVLVVVDEPKGTNAYGSTVALPVAKEIIDGLLVIEKIPPSVLHDTFEPARG